MLNPHTTTYDVPLSAVMIDELVGFWEGIFGTCYNNLRPVLAGRERRQNHDSVYVARVGTKLASTCHLTISQSAPELGGFGEVGTAREFRRIGMASILCKRARTDFRKSGGQALFLGTVNAAAARVYMRLGWRKFAGTNVMGLIPDGRSPETFLVDYFRQGDGPMKVTSGSANDRIPMIPLFICPNKCQVLDANIGMFSTRYMNQNSCMGLYTRYELIRLHGRGTWFGVRNDEGCMTGLSTSRLDDFGRCQVDAFTHHDHPSGWRSLLEAAISWARSCGVTRCWVRVSVEDEDKMSAFGDLGFRETGDAEPFDINQRKVASVRLEKDY